MTREIKFRAWDTDDAIMYMWNYDFFSDMSPVTGYGGEFPTDRDNIKLMQFTGLLDKDGKEIYEGDIVDALPNYGAYYPNRQVVEYHALAFQFIGKTKNASPHVEYTQGTITNKEISKARRVVVVGNIYENGDLLEELNDN